MLVSVCNNNGGHFNSDISHKQLLYKAECVLLRFRTRFNRFVYCRRDQRKDYKTPRTLQTFASDETVRRYLSLKAITCLSAAFYYRPIESLQFVRSFKNAVFPLCSQFSYESYQNVMIGYNTEAYLFRAEFVPYFVSLKTYKYVGNRRNLYEYLLNFLPN